MGFAAPLAQAPLIDEVSPSSACRRSADGLPRSYLGLHMERVALPGHLELLTK